MAKYRGKTSQYWLYWPLYWSILASVLVYTGLCILAPVYWPLYTGPCILAPVPLALGTLASVPLALGTLASVSLVLEPWDPVSLVLSPVKPRHPPMGYWSHPYWPLYHPDPTHQVPPHVSQRQCCPAPRVHAAWPRSVGCPPGYIWKIALRVSSIVSYRWGVKRVKTVINSCFLV